MPLVSCTKNGKKGWKWGKDNPSCFTSKKKAMKQGVAIELDKQRRGEKSDFDKSKSRFSFWKNYLQIATGNALENEQQMMDMMEGEECPYCHQTMRNCPCDEEIDPELT